LGVPEKMMRLIIELHEGFTARVRHHGKWSELFPLSVGLKQGSVLSPLLFNIFFGVIVAQINKRFTGISGAGVQLKINFSCTIEGDRRAPVGGEVEQMEMFNVLFADDCEIFAISRDVGMGEAATRTESDDGSGPHSATTVGVETNYGCRMPSGKDEEGGGGIRERTAYQQFAGGTQAQPHNTGLEADVVEEVEEGGAEQDNGNLAHISGKKKRKHGAGCIRKHKKKCKGP